MKVEQKEKKHREEYLSVKAKLKVWETKEKEVGFGFGSRSKPGGGFLKF